MCQSNLYQINPPTENNYKRWIQYKTDKIPKTESIRSNKLART